MWRLVLKQGISIGAFIETLENDSSELAGYNILFVKTLKDKDQLFAKWQVYLYHNVHIYPFYILIKKN